MSSPSLLRALPLALLAALALLTVTAKARAVSGPEAVARAQQWVDAGVPYCQCPYGGSDKKGPCVGRPENPAWDPYRSDCSGLVSWAWDLGGPGPVTWSFAPFDGSFSHAIDWSELAPGDALNSQEHIMLFAGWVSYGSVATLIDEHNWGTTARRLDFDVSVNGSTVARSDWPSNPFTAIRYNAIQSCQAHCEGSVMVGADCGKGDCGAFGATCTDDQLGLRCVSVFCAPLGDSDVCLPDGHTLGHCSNGGISVGDCAAYGSICSTKGGAHCLGAYDAELVSKGSDAMKDPEGKADFKVCAGASVETSFELRNTAILPWTDSSDPAAGKSVRLGTSAPPDQNFADPFTGDGRASLAANANPDVHRDGPDCSDKPGCNATRFRLLGKAPAKPGVYATSWQLVDELHAWFGPVVAVTYDVVTCTTDTPPQKGIGGGELGAPPGGGAGAAGAGDGANPADSSDAANAANGPANNGGCAIDPLGSSSGAGALLALAAAAGLVKRRRGARG